MTKARNLADNALTTVSPTELGYVDGVTSPIQTQLDAKTAKSTLTTTGDIYYASAANTPARLGIGTASQILAVNSGATAPEWVAAPSSGGMTLISTTTLSSTSVTLSSIPATYNKLYVVLSGATWSTNLSNVQFLPNNLSTNYGVVTTSEPDNFALSGQPINTNRTALNTGGVNVYALEIDNYANTSYFKPFRLWGYQERTGSAAFAFQAAGGVRTTSAISSLVIKTSNNDTFSAGQVLLYGVK